MGLGIRGNLSSRRGFTLVELLVVIGIIGLLVAILLPALNMARQQANWLTCEANLRSIGQAIQIYIYDNRGTLPYGYWDGSFSYQTGQDLYGYSATSAADWTVLLQGLISTTGGSTFASDTPGMKSKIRAVFMDPEAPQDGTSNSLNYSLVQYTCHPRLMPQVGTPDFCGGPNAYLRPYNIAHLKRTASIALIFDAVVVPIFGGGWSTPYNQPVAQALDNERINNPVLGSDSTYLTDQYGRVSQSQYDAGMNPGGMVDMTVTTPVSNNGANVMNADVLQAGQNIRFRHMGNHLCNALMCDMHVESFTLQMQSPTQYSTDLLRSNINVNP